MTKELCAETLMNMDLRLILQNILSFALTEIQIADIYICNLQSRETLLHYITSI